MDVCISHVPRSAWNETKRARLSSLQLAKVRSIWCTPELDTISPNGPISQCIWLYFICNCVIFTFMYWVQVCRRSKWIPLYLTWYFCGIDELKIFNAGHESLLWVKVTCVQLLASAIIFNFSSHYSKVRRCFCIWPESTIGLLWMLITAVLYTMVEVWVPAEIKMSNV